jgi:hypothetical protein
MTPARRAVTKEEKKIGHKEHEGHVGARFIAPSVIRKNSKHALSKPEGSTKEENIFSDSITTGTIPRQLAA